MTKDTYIKRRRLLKEKVREGIIVFPGNSLSSMTYEANSYDFYQDSTFRYYFGINRNDLTAVIDIDNNKEYIFGYDFTLNDIIWMGSVKSLKEEAYGVGVENTGSLEELKSLIAKLNRDRSKIHFINQYRWDNKILISEIIGCDPRKVNDYVSPSLSYAVANQRNIKSMEEILELEKATNVTRLMHLEAMRNVKPGMKEYEVEALIRRVARENNSNLSFPTISTINGQILHNEHYANELISGRMMLVDCGAKIESGYCGDMTTSYPVDKKFNERQRDLYNILINAYNHGETAMKAGTLYKDVHLEVATKLAEGLRAKNILKGRVEDIVANGAHALFMPHGLGHMIGLDVHDMENIGEKIVGYGNEKRSTQFGLSALRMGRELENGFTFTMEPGIYFIPELIKKWHKEGVNSNFINFDEVEKYLDFGGMRYEGDYVIENGKGRRLGKKMPKSVEEVECERAKAFEK